MARTQKGQDQFAFPAHDCLGKPLEPSPAGTSGSISSQSNNNSSWSVEISRSRTRSARWRKRGRGRLSRRTLGMSRVTVETAFEFLFQALNFGRIVRGDHAVSQMAQFFRTEPSGRFLRSR